jgi:tRNA nucleotidyltransferase/poly(A) polymerase
MNIKDDFILKNINEGYLVGGMVRDFLMGVNIKSIKDRDISIKNAEDFSKKLAEELDATFITLDSENKIFRLVLSDKENYLCDNCCTHIVHRSLSLYIFYKNNKTVCRTTPSSS